MRNLTREVFNGYLDNQAKINGVRIETIRSGAKFVVSPSVAQTLEDRIQESSGFLKLINSIPVTDQEGENLGLGTGSTIAGTTDTSGGTARSTTDPTGLNQFGYRCEQTNFDTHLRYVKMDMWAKFPDFQTRCRDANTRQIARDRLMIGWNGTSRAATSNRGANPLLQDVNKGWLQYVRDNDAARIMIEGVAASGKIKVDDTEATADYKNLDALVFDMVNTLLDEWHAEDTEMVAIVGRQLLSDKYFQIVDDSNPATEKVAADILLSKKQLGGLPVYRVPFFPSRTIVVTTLKNLSIYWQEGTRRRSIKDKPELDQVEDYQSVNEAYVVEDTGAFCAAENISYWTGVAWD